MSSQAVERYLLGQMDDSETESFEMHFFECTECTEEIESGTVLAENVRAAFTHGLPKAGAVAMPVPEPRSNTWAWLAEWWRRPLVAMPALAAVVLAAITVYQSGFLVPALRQEVAQAGAPQALLAFTIRSASRGEENTVKVPVGVKAFALQVDLADASFPRYRCVLSGGSEAASFSVDSPAPLPGSPLGILIPVRGLHAGAYTLRVSGIRDSVASPEIAHYSFLLQLQ